MYARHGGRLVQVESQAPLYVLLIVTGLLVLLGLFVHGDSAAWQPVVVVAAEPLPLGDGLQGSSGPEDATAVTVLTHPTREPTRIVIPSIEVDAPVVPVGLLDNGDMETPHTGYVGWYSLGPAPGEPGPAVMLAHVDTARAADVFYNLKKLVAGAEIYVYGPTGDPAVFVVEGVEEQLKIDLPRDRIWDYTKTSVIRLITCGGKWDAKTHHYLSNVIVYGHLVK